MKTKIILLATLFFAFSLPLRAQHFAPDAQEEHLKGRVKSVLTTVRTPQGRIVGQPVRQNYNRDGYFTRNTYYDTMGNPVIIVNYTYDKKKRTIVADMLGLADSLRQHTVYSYDKKNVLQKVTTYDEANKELSSITYDYNDFGYVRYATYTEGENMIYKGANKFRYDTEGHLAERCSYYLTTLRQAFLYTYYYDSEGNWVEAYVFHVTPSEGYLYQVISRQITYYEE